MHKRATDSKLHATQSVGAILRKSQVRTILSPVVRNVQRLSGILNYIFEVVGYRQNRSSEGGQEHLLLLEMARQEWCQVLKTGEGQRSDAIELTISSDRLTDQELSVRPRQKPLRRRWPPCTYTCPCWSQTEAGTQPLLCRCPLALNWSTAKALSFLAVTSSHTDLMSVKETATMNRSVYSTRAVNLTVTITEILSGHWHLLVLVSFSTR